MRSIFFVIFCMINISIEQTYFSMSDEQPERYDFDFDSETFYSPQQLYLGLFFGVASYYLPLSVPQTGSIGLFDSNCYNLCSVTQRETKNLNFLYYDCFDYENRQITKNIRFKDYNGLEHFYSLPIETVVYENNWYCFQMRIWPRLNLVKIYIQQSGQEIFFKELSIKYPFFQDKLTLTIGGGVDSHFFSEQIRFSYFPGYMLNSHLNTNGQDPNTGIIDCLNDLDEIECHSLTLLNSNKFLKDDLMQITTGYSNSDSFSLAGWIKIIQVFGGEKDFTYKLLKLTMNSQNHKLTNDNLSPFCLSYLFSSQGNQIIITAYSYKFPYINQDFTKNPNLITQSLDIKSDIMLWHYLNVQLSQKILFVKITFYDETHTQYQKQIPVNQFQRVVFSLLLGNIEADKDNSIQFVASQFQYSNYDSNNFIPACHSSCYECNGPTSQDCLSCPIQSGRYYVAELQQCICPLFTVENQKCQTHSDLNFNIIVNDSLNLKQKICLFGYFQIDQECILCPSIINTSQITCLECLNNPLQWIYMLYCSTSLISTPGYSFQTITEIKQYFIFDGIQINFCQYCTNICLDQQCISNHYDYNNLPQILLCTDVSNKNCYFCKIKNCIKCDTNIIWGPVCVVCEDYYELIEGSCRQLQFDGGNYCIDNCASCSGNLCISCFPPYYISSDKLKCSECNIRNCQYCFEYQANDRTRSTLYKDFQPFEPDSDTLTGCSLCYEGYYFDFNLGKCIYGYPKDKNCLRSFKDVTKGEICLLSAIDDFDIAPQIINCQVHILNCEQCILTPNQIIQCIICAQGYTASYRGTCDICKVKFANRCINGEYMRSDYWVQLIQSFLVKFLPDQYIYNYNSLLRREKQYPLICEQGYKITKQQNCVKNCDSDCQQCSETVIDFHIQFVCLKCPINYYGFQGLSIQKESCLICSELCQICQVRGQDEIKVSVIFMKAINPDFIQKNSNFQYTYRCLKAVLNERVIIDQKNQIAKYCFDDNCLGGVLISGQQVFSMLRIFGI